MGLSFKSTQGKYSFCNDEKKKVLFSLNISNEGAEDIILDPKWSKNGYSHSIKHIRKVIDEGYDLFVYHVETKKVDGEVKLIGFHEELEKRKLVEDFEREGVFRAIPVDSILNGDGAWRSDDPVTDDDVEYGIRNSNDILDTEKEQIILSRRGQGRFRNAVKEVEGECRVTGMPESEHLIASHIKPWRFSSNKERLDGNNGLFLTPSIDHLFDKGYISFRDNGEVLISPFLSDEAADLFGVLKRKSGGAFSAKQSFYLEYHRDNIFKSG